MSRRRALLIAVAVALLGLALAVRRGREGTPPAAGAGELLRVRCPAVARIQPGDPVEAGGMVAGLTVVADGMEDPEVLYGLAVEAEKGGDLSSAIAYYAKIVNSLTREQVAANRQFQRVMGLTINALQPKLQEDLENAALWDLFGYAWFKLGGRGESAQWQSLEQAYHYCKHAQTINPNLPHVIEHLREIEAALAAAPAPAE